MWDGRHRPVLHHSLLLDGRLLPAAPKRGRSTEFIPSPASIENYQAVFSAQNNFGRSLINSLIVAGTTTILTLLFGIIGRTRSLG